MHVKSEKKWITYQNNGVELHICAMQLSRYMISFNAMDKSSKNAWKWGEQAL